MAGVQLTVTEGRVRVVAPPANSASGVTDLGLMVDAGRSVTVGVGNQDIEPPKRVQPEVVTAWTRGMIVFDAVPLGEAVREISRYSRVRFQIDNNEINQLPVSGYFRAGDTDALVESLKSNFNVESRREGDEIVLWAADDR
jgi:transmembrane sensor